MTRPRCPDCDAVFDPADPPVDCPECGGRVVRPSRPARQGLPATIVLAVIVLVVLAVGLLGFVLTVNKGRPRNLAVAAGVAAVSAACSVGLLAGRESARVLTGLLAVLWVLAGGLVSVGGLLLVPAFGAGCFILPFGVVTASAGMGLHQAAHAADTKRWCRR